MDERRLKYLYATLAVAFGLPSLVVGGAAATMLLLTGLGQFGHGTLAAVTVMPVWGVAGIAGCLALVVAQRRVSAAGACRAAGASPLVVAAAGRRSCRRTPLGLALWWSITVHAEGIALLLLGPSMLVPAAMLVWIKRRA